MNVNLLIDGITGLGLAAGCETHFLEENGGQFFGRVDIEGLAGVLIDRQLGLVHRLPELTAELVQKCDIDCHPSLFHRTENRHQGHLDIGKEVCEIPFGELPLINVLQANSGFDITTGVIARFIS